jgi:hypothetical protein
MFLAPSSGTARCRQVAAAEVARSAGLEARLSDLSDVAGQVRIFLDTIECLDPAPQAAFARVDVRRRLAEHM